MPKPKIPNQRKAQLEHKKRIERYVALINQLYDKLNKEASKLALATEHDPAKQFLWSDYPQTKAALEKLQSQYISEMSAIIIAGTSAEWKESNLVQDLVAKKLLKAYTGTTKAGEEYTRYFETNPASLQAFQKRKTAGMGLSTRVWNLSEQYKTELEMAVSAAIEPGTSPMELAADIKKYLNEPDKMFRRFRYKDENGEWKRKWKQKVMGGDGKVHFIDADPTEYHPGRGVYRSSARNAQRLARTEINMSYRTAEQERWRQFDFVVGYEVKTTQNGRHVEDICDCLAGKYRKDFKFLGWHPQCYPIGTEVLTNAGWKQFKDISDDDLIMSLNPETRALEYVSIADRQCYDFNGELVRFFNKSLDCAVTPEHRMVYLNKGDGRIKYCPASEFRMTMGAFYRGAMYDAEEREWFEIEGRKIRFDDYCAFMGYYLSDGCLQHGTGVVIAQQAGLFAFYDIADTIAKMGYNISFTLDAINIYNSALNRYLSQFGRCNDKHIPNEIKTASKRQIKIFLDAFIRCDGSVRKFKTFIGNHGNAFNSDKEERIYFTTSERLAGDLSELILKVGHRPSFEFQEPKTTIKKDGSIIKSNYICYRIRECYSTTATVFKKELMPYSGKVYDLTLERNHIMYVRRNGKCFWGSNCMCYSIPILKTEDEFFDDDEDAPSVNEVEDVPQGFKDWIADNKDRIEAAEQRGTLPYFIRDNRGAVDAVLKPETAAVEPKPKAKAEEPKVKTEDDAIASALGIERGKPMTHEEADKMRPNPHFKEDIAHQTNCQCSVMAYELRRRGWDVEAFGNTKEKNTVPFALSKKPFYAWLDANGNPPIAKDFGLGKEAIYTQKNGVIGIRRDKATIERWKNNVMDSMKEPGRYQLRWSWKNSNSGHTVVAERFEDGSLLVHDAQSGKPMKLDWFFWNQKINVSIKGGVSVLRIDNLQPNIDVLRGAVKPAGSKATTPLMDEVQKAWWKKHGGKHIEDYVEGSKYSTIDERLRALHTAKGKDVIELQREVIADRRFKPVEKLKGILSAISETDPDYERLIAGAKRAVEHGYEVFLMPNPKGIRTTDYILRKKGFVGSYDLKTIMGDNSVSNRLAESIGQTKRVILNMATQYNPRTLANDIRSYFESYEDALEVKIFKGGREIRITRKQALENDFINTFRKNYSKRK